MFNFARAIPLHPFSLAMMEGRVIEYRPLGGGLDYHNSPLIGEIPTNDLYHTHRSIDQLRSLNDRDTLINGHPPPTITDLKTSAAALQLDYKNYNNNAGEIRSHQQQHPHHGQHHHHQQHQQHHHDEVDYMKHVADMNGSTGANVDQNGSRQENGGGHTVITTDGNILIEEQSDKMEMVLKQVEKHEVDSVYHASASGTPSPPLSSPSEPTERVGRGRKKVQTYFVCVAQTTRFGFVLFLAYKVAERDPREPFSLCHIYISFVPRIPITIFCASQFPQKYSLISS